MHNLTHAGFEAGEYLSMATLPVGNPTSVDELIRHSRYAITLIEHDYSGKTSAMWNAVYRHFNMNVVMAMMVGCPENAYHILEALRNDPRYIGGGSGVGFKDENVKHLDDLDPLAEAIGAVNLIEKLPSGKLKGWNTDAIGYVQSLEELLEKQGKAILGANVVMLGAGGTGNAIAFVLAEKGARICIINRTVAKAEELAGRINSRKGALVAHAFAEDVLPQMLSAADVVINTSTKGATGDYEAYSALAPAKLPATPENIRENLEVSLRAFDLIPRTTIVSDIVLRNEPTPFLKQAHEKGFGTLDGVPMVINQGVEAFLILHGDEIGRTEDVKETLREVMKAAAGL